MRTSRITDVVSDKGIYLNVLSAFSLTIISKSFNPYSKRKTSNLISQSKAYAKIEFALLSK